MLMHDKAYITPVPCHCRSKGQRSVFSRLLTAFGMFWRQSHER